MKKFLIVTAQSSFEFIIYLFVTVISYFKTDLHTHTLTNWISFHSCHTDDITMTADGVDTYQIVKDANRYKWVYLL